MLTNFDHDRQWFNTLTPPSHKSAAVTVDCISRLSGPGRLSVRYTTSDRERRYECDGGISQILTRSGSEFGPCTGYNIVMGKSKSLFDLNRHWMIT